MKKKHYHILQACLYGIGTLFIISSPLWIEVDNPAFGYPFILFMIVIFGYLSFKNFKQIKESREEDQVYRPNTEDSIEEQIAFYKKYTVGSAVGLSLLSIITILDLNDLVSGREQEISLLEPAAFIYEQFGYWPALLTIPFIGVIITLLGVRKLNILKSTVKNQT